MRNVAVLDSGGHLISEMKSAPHGLLPLSTDVLAQARAGSFIGPSADGRSLVMVLPANGRIVAIEVDPHVFSFVDARCADRHAVRPAARARQNWNDRAGRGGARADGCVHAARIVEFPHDARLVSLAKLSGWPLVAGSIGGCRPRARRVVRHVAALSCSSSSGRRWPEQGSPPCSCANSNGACARQKPCEALRSTRPEEARLLVRLADAERRAMHAERAKADFMAHMSHELRTPLNAIIGFAEVIESSMFGATGHPKYVEYARDIGRAGRQLHGRVGEILEFVDLDARQHPDHVRHRSISPCLRAKAWERSCRRRAVAACSSSPRCRRMCARSPMRPQ
jgi:hypothetical protein